MSEDNGFLIARARMEVGAKVTISVEGSVMTYSQDAKVAVRFDPGDFNPTFFGVRVDVTEGTGPRKGTMHPFEKSFVADSSDYQTARVSAFSSESGEIATVSVDILKDRP